MHHGPSEVSNPSRVLRPDLESIDTRPPSEGSVPFLPPYQLGPHPEPLTPAPCVGKVAVEGGTSGFWLCPRVQVSGEGSKISNVDDVER